MGYDTEIPAHQIGGHMVLWAIRGYGLSEVWVKTSSTVLFAPLFSDDDQNLTCEPDRLGAARWSQSTTAKLWPTS